VSMTPAISEKLFEAEMFSYFVEMQVGCCLHLYYDFVINVPFEV
jgi:hypothetical protein